MTGAAIQVGSTPFSTSLSDGAAYGFDFNPTVDRIRVVNDLNQNFRLHPVTGALAGSDTNLAFAAGDASVGEDPVVVAAAYDRNDVNTGTPTTLVGINFGADTLVRQGGVDGAPSPNNGELTTIGIWGSQLHQPPLASMSRSMGPSSPC